jgi:hypothetical protein
MRWKKNGMGRISELLNFLLDYRLVPLKVARMEWPILCQGRSLDEPQAQWLRSWIAAQPQWSRKRVARELCLLWEWQDGKGRLKDFAARSFLLKLEARGLIELPLLQVHQRRPAAATRLVPEVACSMEPIEGSFAQIEPVRVEAVVAGSEEARRVAFYLDRFHYLGWRVVGENLAYLARDRQGRDLGVLLFGAPAWRCAPRDRHLGWDETQRRAGLAAVANNTRFLILPQVRVPHLASHLLARCARRIDKDWRRKYGHGLEWLETFVDAERFAGTCYRAANWRHVGFTQGRSRQDRDRTLQVPRKAVFLYQLR